MLFIFLVTIIIRVTLFVLLLISYHTKVEKVIIQGVESLLLGVSESWLADLFFRIGPINIGKNIS